MLNKDFKELLRLFNAHRVEYLLVGGYALAAYGHPRYTGDIDLWINRAEPNIANVLKALEDFGFGELGIQARDLSSPNSVIQLGYPPARIDLLSSIDGVNFDDCYLCHIVMRIDGIDLPIINIADFRTNKLATGRLQDLADVATLDENKTQNQD